MKVLLVNHFPLEGSGSGTYTMNTAQHLAKRGNEVCVIFPENRVPAPIQGIEMRPVYFTGMDGIVDASIVEAASSGEPASAAIGGDELGSLKNPLSFNFPCFTTHPRSLMTFDDMDDAQLEQYMDAFMHAIDEAVAQFEPDIIHAQHVWLLADAAARSSVPTILTAHGTDMMGYRKWPRFRNIADDAVRLCKKIIAISKDNYDDTVETIPAAKDKMVLLLNGYNEDIFYVDDVDKVALLAEHGIDYDGQDIVLFAGKLTNFKGVDTLLKAAQRYEDELPNAITLIAGSGEEAESLGSLAKELDLQRTFFLGHQMQDDLRNLYNIADVFAMPSRREPFGLVALEAMACGLPVVATNQGGLVEFVTEDVGTLVDVDDDKAMAAEVIAELSSEEDRAARRAYIANKTLEEYAQSKFVVRLEKLYEQVIG